MIAGLALQSTYERRSDDPLAAAPSAALLLVTGVIWSPRTPRSAPTHISPLDTPRRGGWPRASHRHPAWHLAIRRDHRRRPVERPCAETARFLHAQHAAILAAGVVQAASRADGPLRPGEAMTLSIGFVVAFVVGYLAIAWLIRYLSRAPLYAFASHLGLGLTALWLLR
jgi:hypothetical protein